MSIDLDSRIPELVAVCDLEPGDVFESFGWQMPVVFTEAPEHGGDYVMLTGYSLRPNGECDRDGRYTYRLLADDTVTVLRAEVPVR